MGIIEQGYCALQKHDISFQAISSNVKPSCDFFAVKLTKDILVRDVFPEFTGKTRHLLFKTECANFVKAGLTQETTIPHELLQGFNDDEITNSVIPSLSNPGVRAVYIVKLIICIVKNPTNLKEFSVTDIFEFLSQISDYINAADSAMIIYLLELERALLNELMSSGAEEYILSVCPEIVSDDMANLKQRLLMARALSIAVLLRLSEILRGSCYENKWKIKCKMLLFGILPETFDGISSKPRGREGPAVLKSYPAHPLNPDDIRAIKQNWIKATEYRQNCGDPKSKIEVEDYINVISVFRMLQDPIEYLAASIRLGSSGGNTSRSVADDDDEREEGEEDEDDEDKALRKKVRHALKQLSAIDNSDALVPRFEEVSKVAQFYRRIIGNSHHGMNQTIVNDESFGLLFIHCLNNPLAFVEIHEIAGPSVGRIIMIHIFTLLRIHFKWPARSGEHSLLEKWVSSVNMTAVLAFKRMMDDCRACLTIENVQMSARLANLELSEFLYKFDGFKNESVPKDSIPFNSNLKRKITAQNEADKKRRQRLNQFQNAACDSLRKVSTNSMEVIPVTPLNMKAAREELYLTSPLPDDYDEGFLTDMLLQRVRDYREKIEIDLDPINEIEPEEQLLSKCMNSWRIARTALMAGNADFKFERPLDRLKSDTHDKHKTLFAAVNNFVPIIKKADIISLRNDNISAEETTMD